MRRFVTFSVLVSLAALLSCSRSVLSGPASEQARYLEILSDTSFAVISPYTGERDTVCVSAPASRLICMSSSYLGYLDAIGATDAVCGVSGIGYISTPSILERHEATLRGSADLPLVDVGYDAAPDYESILALRPDYLVTYTVSASEPPFLSKLRSLGVPVLVIYEHVESHPLARSSYVRLFGALTGRMAAADSAFAAVSEAYRAVVKASPDAKVLMNIPYGDAWYVPGEDNYFSQMVSDAGGRILGAGKGSESRIMSLEEALLLEGEADVWLNTGACDTRSDLASALPAFRNFGNLRIFNNSLRRTPGGGNDFWESGAFRSDLILSDLASIMSGVPADSLNYYREVR